ncbi:MAG: type II toxin-antitoxin system VapC family toxin [Gemmatimonadota bacterium]
MTSISQRLAQAHLVHIDARIFALHLVGNPRTVALTREVISGMREGRIRGQTSVVTLYQVLAELYRRGEPRRAAALARDLMVHAGLALVPTSPDIAVQAAEVRAQLGGRPERALQVATALVGRADVFLTTDSGLRRIAGMSVVNLEDFSRSSRPDEPDAPAP